MPVTYQLEWDKTGERFYESGVSHGVLYPMNDNGIYPKGVAWNGLTAVNESPSGAEATALYADNMKYLELRSAEQFGATIQAYTFPKEFYECDGSAFMNVGSSTVDFITVGQQSRKVFGLAYKTIVGNDTSMNDYSYKIHMVYGATASPSQREYQTVNESPEAIQFSWEFATTPVEIPKTIGDYRPTSCLTINSTELTTPEAQAALKTLEDKLYGTENTDSTLPSPGEVYEIFGSLTEGNDDNGDTPAQG